MMNAWGDRFVWTGGVWPLGALTQKLMYGDWTAAIRREKEKVV